LACDADANERAEGDVERFAEASIAVVVDFSRVYDDADPELLVQAVGTRRAGVVFVQELAECGYSTIQQDRLGGLVDRVDEREEAVAAVVEPVTMLSVDSRRVQRLVE
jgi:hypothetical protein